MAGTGLQGAYALQSLDDLLQRRMMERLAAEKVAEQRRQFDVGANEKRRAHDLEMRRHELSLAQRGDVLGETTRQHDIQRAGNIVENAVPGDTADQPTQDLLSKFGYGGAVRTVTQDPFEGVDTERMGGPDVTKTGFLRGGSKYLTAEQNRINQAAIASERTGAQRETAAASLENRRGQQSIQNEIARGNLAIRGQLAESTIQGRTDKAEAARTKQEDLENRARAKAEEGLRSLGSLLTPESKLTPGAKSRLGYSSYIPAAVQSLNPLGDDSRAAEASLNQLVARQTLGALTELRRESPTGGALGNVSDKDIAILERASTILSQRNLPEAIVEQEIQHVRDVFARIARGQKAGVSGGGGGRKRYDLNGNPLP